MDCTKSPLGVERVNILLLGAHTEQENNYVINNTCKFYCDCTSKQSEGYIINLMFDYRGSCCRATLCDFALLLPPLWPLCGLLKNQRLNLSVIFEDTQIIDD